MFCIVVMLCNALQKPGVNPNLHLALDISLISLRTLRA